MQTVTKRKLKKSGGVIFAVILLAAAAAFFLLPNSLTRYVNENGSSNLGRDLSVENINIDWHWHTPHVSIDQLRIANTDGAPDPDMVDIENIEFDIRMWKLLFAKVDMPNLSITSPKIILERKADQTANWQFSPLSKENIVTDAAVPESRFTFPDIQNLSIRDGQIIYRDEVRNIDLDVALDSVTGQGGEEDKDIDNTNELKAAPERQKLKVSGQGNYQGQPFKLTAEGGSVDALRGSLQDFPLIADIKMGPTHVHIDGVFQDPVKMQGIDAKLSISGNNLADLYYLTAIPLPPTPKYQINGRLGRTNETWSYKNFSGQVGGSDLGGSLSYDTSGERGYVKADLNSKRFDIADLGGFIGITPSNPVPSERFFPDIPLNLERLRSADMDVRLKIDQLVAPNIPFDQLDVTFDLKNGILKLNPLSVSLAGGKLDGQLTLNGQNAVPAVSTDLNVRQLKIRQFFEGTRFEELTNGQIGGNIKMSGNGLSLSDVMAGSEGDIIISMDGGQLSRLLIEASDLDIAEASPLFFGKDDITQVRCAVGDFNVNNGLLKSELFVIDTEDSNIQGDITVDFLTEGIDAEINAASKNPSPFSLQTPIKIKGPLKEPGVSIDLLRGGLRGAAAVVLGSLLTPAAGLLPFIEVGLGKDSDCYKILSEQ